MLKNFSYVFILLLLILTINAQLQGQWPQPDRPPPPYAKWTKLVNQSKVPKAPISKVPGDCGLVDNFCNWSCSQCIRPNSDIVQCPGKYDWSLTFDDGPTEFTDTLLDYLSSVQIKVTFFVVGSRVYENPQILQKAVAAGHQIGVHTWSHTGLTMQTNEQIIAEMKWTELAIKQASGITPKYMRPPYGDVDDRVRAVLSQLGYKVVMWDKDSNDWRLDSDPNFKAEYIEGNFTEWVKENSPTGHISLEHDLYREAAARGQIVVPIVQGAGFTISPVSTCVGDAKPYLESQDPVTNPAPVANPAINPAPATNLDTAPAKDPDPETGPTSVSPAPTKAASSQGSTISNTISYNSNYLLSSVLFILGSYLF